MSTPDHLFGAQDHHRLLSVGQRPHGTAMAAQLLAQLQGPALEWLVNADARKRFDAGEPPRYRVAGPGTAEPGVKGV